MTRPDSPVVRPSVPRLRRILLAWYRRAGRDLPWRRTDDPYAVWISEVMLQQTTVAVAAPYYDRFLSKYPDVGSLARSREDELLALWSGLGYYRRARNLRAAARMIVQEHRERFPSRPAQLLALPGIGRYTAGAIAAICFGVRTPAVDGNAARVIARLHALAAPTAAKLWEIAEALVPRDAPGEWTQALMELGATICRPLAPACAACPVARECRVFSEGRDPERYPAARARPVSVPVRADLAVIRRRGKILLVRRPEGELLGGLWELPGTLAGALDRAGRATREDGPPRASTAFRNSPETGGAGGRAGVRGSRLPRAAAPAPRTVPATKRTLRGEGTAAPGRGSSKRRSPAGIDDSDRIDDSGRQELLNTLSGSLALAPHPLERLGLVRHTITRHRIEIVAWRGEAPPLLPSVLRSAHGRRHLWADPGQLVAIPIGAASRKVISAALAEPARRPAALGRPRTAPRPPGLRAPGFDATIRARRQE